MRVAFEEGQIEDPEEVGIDTDQFLLFELPRSIPDEIIAQLSQPGEGPYLRIGCGHARSNCHVDHGIVGLRGGGNTQVDAVDVSARAANRS